MKSWKVSKTSLGRTKSVVFTSKKAAEAFASVHGGKVTAVNVDESTGKIAKSRKRQGVFGMAHSSKEREQLESLLDRMGVKGMMEALSQIASEKEDHVLESWQDSHLAKRWARLAGKFDKLSTTIDDPYYQR